MFGGAESSSLGRRRSTFLGSTAITVTTPVKTAIVHPPGEPVSHPLRTLARAVSVIAVLYVFLVSRVRDVRSRFLGAADSHDVKPTRRPLHWDPRHQHGPELVDDHFHGRRVRRGRHAVDRERRSHHHGRQHRDHGHLRHRVAGAPRASSDGPPCTWRDF
jgi:hypothetical protein